MSSTIQDLLLPHCLTKIGTYKKLYVESKKRFQLPDQANNDLVLVQTCSSSLGIYQYVTALLRQHHVGLHVVKTL